MTHKIYRYFRLLKYCQQNPKEQNSISSPFLRMGVKKEGKNDSCESCRKGIRPRRIKV